jgi:hypothetical protein
MARFRTAPPPGKRTRAMNCPYRAHEWRSAVRFRVARQNKVLCAALHPLALQSLSRTETRKTVSSAANSCLRGSEWAPVSGPPNSFSADALGSALLRRARQTPSAPCCAFHEGGRSASATMAVDAAAACTDSDRATTVSAESSPAGVVGDVLMLVIQHQPHHAGTDLRRKLVACLLPHGSTFSKAGASGKPGAVQCSIALLL